MTRARHYDNTIGKRQSENKSGTSVEEAITGLINFRLFLNWNHERQKREDVIAKDAAVAGLSYPTDTPVVREFDPFDDESRPIRWRTTFFAIAELTQLLVHPPGEPKDMEALLADLKSSAALGAMVVFLAHNTLDAKDNASLVPNGSGDVPLGCDTLNEFLRAYGHPEIASGDSNVAFFRCMYRLSRMIVRSRAVTRTFRDLPELVHRIYNAQYSDTESQIYKQRTLDVKSNRGDAPLPRGSFDERFVLTHLTRMCFGIRSHSRSSAVDQPPHMYIADLNRLTMPLLGIRDCAFERHLCLMANLRYVVANRRQLSHPSPHSRSSSSSSSSASMSLSQDRGLADMDLSPT